MSQQLNPYETKSEQPRLLDALSKGVVSGDNFAVIGLEGSGRTELMEALYVQTLPVERAVGERRRHMCLVVDMLNLIEPCPARFYQLILRTFSEQCWLLPACVQQSVGDVSFHAKNGLDAFQLQSRLRGILFQIASNNHQLTLIMDRFDDACDGRSFVVLEALDALRKGLESTLTVVFGCSVDLFMAGTAGRSAYSQQRLRLRSLWLDCSELSDVQQRLRGNLAHTDATECEIATLANWSGGFPALADALAKWWLACDVSVRRYTDTITSDIESAYNHPNVQAAIALLWDGLRYYERSVLHELCQVKPSAQAKFVKRNLRILQSLIRRGVVRDAPAGVVLFTPLLELWLQDMRHTIRGNVWFNEEDDTFYQGERPLEMLSPRAEAALQFFLANAYKKCDKDQLIAHVWETPYVTDDSVYQVIRELRRMIEPDSRRPCYLLNHRSLRGGRYQFFPEGRSESFKHF